MNTKRTKRIFIVRAATMLLMMLLTSTTVWADNGYNYIAADGSERNTYKDDHIPDGNVTVLSGGNTTEFGTNGGSYWYVVTGLDVKYNDWLTFKGNTHIILKDEAQITIETNDNENGGINSKGSLTIYGQSKGTGSLIILNKGGMGIYASNDITINGGSLTIKSHEDGIVTDGDNININGGSVTVTPYDQDYRGIYSAGNINITSGQISATSTVTSNEIYNSSIEAFYNINLGCKKQTDYIFACNYSASNISIYSDLPLIDGTNIYTNTTTVTTSLGNKTFAPDLFGISYGNNGSSSSPYIISTPQGLQLLATYVNNGEDFSGKSFLLGNNINMNGIALEPIGKKEINPDISKFFSGIFDGNGHTISNINISKNKGNVGLFGYLANGAIVKNLTLDHATMTGNYTGGIAGFNESSTITNCIVRNATITGQYQAGAIIGDNAGTLLYNYYSGCTVGGSNYNVGCGTDTGSFDITTNDGAVCKTNAIIISESESIGSWPTFNQNDEIFFFREFTGESPSTICLPFAYTPEASIGTFYTFTGVEEDNWVATMTEVNGALAANTPYIFKAASTGTVMFHGPAAASKSNTSAGTTTSGSWTFKGTYNEIKWSKDPPVGIYGFSAQAVEDQDIYQGQFVKVGIYVKIRPLRAYLQYGSATTRSSLSEEELPDRIMVRLVGSGETSIGQLDLKTGEVTFDDGWYTLEGIRLNGKPTKQGIYVNKGKKYIIK